MKLILTPLFLLFTVIIHAQPESKDVSLTFLDAEYFLSIEEYEEALVNYLQIYDNGYHNNSFINYKIGLCKLNLCDKSKAIPYLEKAVENITYGFIYSSTKEMRTPIDAYLLLGDAYRSCEKYVKAKRHYEKFVSLMQNKLDPVLTTYIEKQIEACNQFATRTLHPVQVSFTPIQLPIENIQLITRLTVNKTGNVLAFSYRHKFYNGLYISRQTNGVWQQPYNITGELMAEDLCPISLSNKGDTLLLLNKNPELCEIYETRFMKNQWSIAEPFNGGELYQTTSFMASFAPKGNRVYFSASLKNSVGCKDLYYIEQNEHGKWGEPISLGNNVNTILNEDYPSLSADGKRLYFCSQGHDTYGGYDVYYSELDENGNWSKPKNLGYPLNTSDDDLLYTQIGNGNSFFLLQREDGKTLEKGIYQVEMVP